MVAWVVHENDHRGRSIMLSPLLQLSRGGGEAAADAMQTPSYAPYGMQVAIMLLLLLLLLLLLVLVLNVACRC